MHIARTLQRYIFVGPLATLYYLVKDGVVVAPQSRVQATKKISFGKGCVVKAFAVIKTTSGRITFGNNCAVSCFDHIDTRYGDITIGNDVRIGPRVCLYGSSRKFKDRNTIINKQDCDDPGLTIGNDVLIGAGAIIFAGLTIGNGAVIGAGSIVTKSVPEYAVVAGNPARVINERR